METRWCDECEVVEQFCYECFDWHELPVCVVKPARRPWGVKQYALWGAIAVYGVFVGGAVAWGVWRWLR